MTLPAVKMTLEELDSSLQQMQIVAHEIQSELFDHQMTIQEKKAQVSQAQDIMRLFTAPSKLPSIKGKLSSAELNERFEVITESIQYLTEHRDFRDAALYLLRYSQMLSSTFQSVSNILARSIQQFVDNTLRSSRAPTSPTPFTFNEALAAHFTSIRPMARVLQDWVSRYNQLDALENLVQTTYRQRRRLVEPGLAAEVDRIVTGNDSPAAIIDLFCQVAALETKAMLSLWTVTVHAHFGQLADQHVARLRKVCKLDNARVMRRRLHSAQFRKEAQETAARLLLVPENRDARVVREALEMMQTLD